MRLTNNEHTLTIGDYALLMSSNDLTLLKGTWLPLPRFYLIRKLRQLTERINLLINEQGVKKLVAKDLTKLKYLTILNIQYKLLFNIWEIYRKTKDESIRKIFDEQYKQAFGKKAPDDIKKVLHEYNRIKTKFTQYYTEEKQENGDIEDLIMMLEVVLSPVTIRDKKLYLLKKYIDLAKDKVKKQKNG